MKATSYLFLGRSAKQQQKIQINQNGAWPEAGCNTVAQLSQQQKFVSPLLVHNFNFVAIFLTLLSGGGGGPPT